MLSATAAAVAFLELPPPPRFDFGRPLRVLRVAFDFFSVPFEVTLSPPTPEFGVVLREEGRARRLRFDDAELELADDEDVADAKLEPDVNELSVSLSNSEFSSEFGSSTIDGGCVDAAELFRRGFLDFSVFVSFLSFAVEFERRTRGFFAFLSLTSIERGTESSSEELRRLRAVLRRLGAFFFGEGLSFVAFVARV